MKIIIEVNSIDELRSLLESIKLAQPIPSADTSPSIDTMGMTLSTKRKLHDDGIKTIDDLCKKSGREIVSIPEVGIKCLKEIRETLATLGLKLRGD